MLAQKYVTLYANSRKVPLDIAERDVVLTYVLKILSEGILPRLAFKGGTCLKKMHFGSSGRFSVDLDFTALYLSLGELQAEIKQLLDGQKHFGIDFKISDENIKKGADECEESYLAVVKYSHNWNADEFMFEVSYREKPLLTLDGRPILDEMYFRYCGFPSFPVQCLQREELLAEKLRAAFQRFRGRDLYDLYLFSDRNFDKELVKTLAVIKCWNVRKPFYPEKLLDNISTGKYDWNDLERLIRKGDLPSQKTVVEKVVNTYAFLKELDDTLIGIIKDSKAHKDKKVVIATLERYKSNPNGST